MGPYENVDGIHRSEEGNEISRDIKMVFHCSNKNDIHQNTELQNKKKWSQSDPMIV